MRFLPKILLRSFMPYDVSGKSLFPHLQPWERRRKTKVILGMFFNAAASGGTVGAVIYFRGIFLH